MATHWHVGRGEIRIGNARIADCEWSIDAGDPPPDFKDAEGCQISGTGTLTPTSAYYVLWLQLWAASAHLNQYRP
jgi:hypothetical protein